MTDASALMIFIAMIVGLLAYSRADEAREVRLTCLDPNNLAGPI